MSSLFADTHNVVAILEKSDAADGFEQIIDFLGGSYIHYALTVNLHIYIAFDRKKIVISEAVIREILQLDDADGVVCLPNEEIFVGLAQMGYEKPSTKLTFYKAFFSSQWKFLIHTLLQSLSAKRNSWNEFSTEMASVVICLSKEEGIAKEQVQADDAVAAAVQENVAEDVTNDAIPSPPSHDIPSPSQAQSSPHQQPQSLPQAPPQDEGIELVKDAHIAETGGRHAAEQAKKQVEIYHLDLDHPSKVLSMQEDDSEVQELVEIVTTTKLITDVVTTASQVSAASATISAAKPSFPAAALTVVAVYTRRRKGVIIRDPKEELSSKTPTETPKLKDKGKGILIETLKPMKKEDQIELDVKYARKLHEEINKDQEEINKDIDWDAAIDHVNQKSKNP
nr:hypothetical protein [Tanacetum cinerariifolium]